MRTANPAMHYPMGDHDDGPDALEMLKSMIEAGLIGRRYGRTSTMITMPRGQENKSLSAESFKPFKGLYSRRA